MATISAMLRGLQSDYTFGVHNLFKHTVRQHAVFSFVGAVFGTLAGAVLYPSTRAARWIHPDIRTILVTLVAIYVVFLLSYALLAIGYTRLERRRAAR